MPPAAYLLATPLPEPSRPIEQNRDLRAHIEQLYLAIGQCNGDKRLIRQWADRPAQPPPDPPQEAAHEQH